MTRQGDSSMPSLATVTAPTIRPKSASAFQSANRKLIAAIPTSNVSLSNQISLHQRRPHSSRYPRPPSTLATATCSSSPRPRPCSAAMQLWRQSGTPVASRHNSIVQRVVREEIDEQRHVTLEAQRQLHEIQATITRRQDELRLARRHVEAFDSSSFVSLTKPTATALGAADDGVSQPSKTHAASGDVVLNLKDEMAHQDAYKKRVRFMHERLLQQVRYLEANADLLAERRRAAHRERTLCRNRVKIEADKNRQLRQQLRELRDKRAAFKRNALPVLESYRDELASRLVITQRRQDADHRREELLRFIGTRTTDGSKVTSRSVTSVTAVITKEQPPVARVQRRDSYRILLADVDENKRETLFAVYEGQYARVLRETGEGDLNVVLDRFQSYRESTARLREIEAELRTEGTRATREQQAHRAMASRLRVSGPTDVVERRQRLRDRLEGALLAQQLDKNQARERVNAQLKAFVYVQQGILHIVELLQCLEGMTLSPPASLFTTARTVMGGSQPTDAALKTVAPALQTLVHLARDVGRRGLQHEWLNLPALGYSEPQVTQLEQFAPVGQAQRGPFAFDEASTSVTNEIERLNERQDDEMDEEQRDAIVVRQAMKTHETETLRQAEAIVRQATENRKFHLTQPHQQQSRPSSPKHFQQRSDAEIVAAHFRHQRRLEKQEQRQKNGNTLQQGPSGHRRSTIGTSVVVPVAAQSPRRRQRPFTD